MASIADMYNSSFGGRQFLTREESGFTPAAPPRSDDYTLLHIPGGNTTVYITSGLRANEYEIPAAADAAQYNDLRGAVGNSGPLSWPGSDGSWGRLLALKDVKKAGIHDIYNFTMVFIPA